MVMLRDAFPIIWGFVGAALFILMFSITMSIIKKNNAVFIKKILIATMSSIVIIMMAMVAVLGGLLGDYWSWLPCLSIIVYFLFIMITNLRSRKGK